jgi:hypothetical protein
MAEQDTNVRTRMDPLDRRPPEMLEDRLTVDALVRKDGPAETPVAGMEIARVRRGAALHALQHGLDATERGCAGDRRSCAHGSDHTWSQIQRGLDHGPESGLPEAATASGSEDHAVIGQRRGCG